MFVTELQTALCLSDDVIEAVLQRDHSTNNPYYTFFQLEKEFKPSKNLGIGVSSSVDEQTFRMDDAFMNDWNNSEWFGTWLILARNRVDQITNFPDEPTNIANLSHRSVDQQSLDNKIILPWNMTDLFNGTVF
ncbi:hypothetical protein Cflav_PD1757 [Pedosphaera parvula Ellin514]|uniref:Uncharacterized protein n=1 Tax=Pedosphaera parvula (strain Ellin514) TaxID=320771 RepID=B9XNM7_PEDPL|nr:hypothetical protein Cflav_PD1757 [Pedosphaera parvula Ellin514]